MTPALRYTVLSVSFATISLSTVPHPNTTMFVFWSVMLSDRRRCDNAQSSCDL